MEQRWTSDGVTYEKKLRMKGISEEVFPCDFLLTQEKLLAFFFGEMGIFVYFCPHYKINEKIHRHIHWTHGHRLPDLLQGSGG